MNVFTSIQSALSLAIAASMASATAAAAAPTPGSIATATADADHAKALNQELQGDAFVGHDCEFTTDNIRERISSLTAILITSDREAGCAAASLVAYGQTAMEQAVAEINGYLNTCPVSERSRIKRHGAVASIRRACARANAPFTLSTSKTGPVEVVPRDTAKPAKPAKTEPKQAAPTSETAPTSDQQDSIAAAALSKLNDELASVRAMLASVTVERDSLIAELASAMLRLTAAESRADREALRADSAERALSIAQNPPAAAAAAAAAADADLQASRGGHVTLSLNPAVTGKRASKRASKRAA